MAARQLNDFFTAKNISFNVKLGNRVISEDDVALLFEIIQNNANKTFNFTYVFNNSLSSPYFPSAAYATSGFSIGLQPTDLSVNCHTLGEWFGILKHVWGEINQLFGSDPDFLGIDSSIAPLFQGRSSLINFIKRVLEDFSNSVTTDIYLQITSFIKTENPKPIGLCGIMLPCLEDFELAQEYELGNFSIERNIYLSLHSGLGIDTYPIGIDEPKEKVLTILKLIQGLSNKYSKPLSVRLVSDGKARIGEMTNFGNPFLKDVLIKSL